MRIKRMAEEEITNEVYELKRREKGKIVEESRSPPSPIPIRSPRIHTDLVSSAIEKLQELTGRYGYLFEHLRAKFLSRNSFNTLARTISMNIEFAKRLLLERQHNKEETDKMIGKAMLLERGRLQVLKFSTQRYNTVKDLSPSTLLLLESARRREDKKFVSLNLLSRTRKLGHSTMELRSLIS
ncbi:hypothetical protein Tco_0269913 [Tanacetum coccineum]